VDRTCIKRIICDGQTPGLEADSPVTNYSSEYNDGVDYPGRKFPPFTPYDPGTTPWTSEACSGMFKCTSYISQEDADDCAAALAAACVNTPHPPTDPTPFCVSNPSACIPYSPGLYTNDLKTASFTCPDGTLFTWSVKAGTIVSTSKSLANSVAQALADKRVLEHAVCLSDIPNSGCVGTDYSGTIIATGEDTYSLAITDGFTPYGMTVENGINSIKISGEASSAGAFFFTVRATGVTNGATATKNYVVSVIGISPNFLPDATISVPYSESIIASGGAPPISMAISSGALPGGLTLSLAGLLSGTPTQSGTFHFNVTATDSVGGTCSKSYSMNVQCSILTASSLPSGATGLSYSQTIAIVGGGTAVWSVIAGALPSGISLDSSSGVISGTPDTAQNTAFTIQALIGEVTCSKAFTIEIGLMGVIVWDPPVVLNNFPAKSILSYSYLPYGSTGAAFSDLPDSPPPQVVAGASATGWMNYKGPALVVRLTASLSATGSTNAASRMAITVPGSGFTEWLAQPPNPPISINQTWTIPDTAGATVQIKFEPLFNSYTTNVLTSVSLLDFTFSVN
jgi:hypothetical protein